MRLYYFNHVHKNPNSLFDFVNWHQWILTEISQLKIIEIIWLYEILYEDISNNAATELKYLNQLKVSTNTFDRTEAVHLNGIWNNLLHLKTA